MKKKQKGAAWHRGSVRASHPVAQGSNLGSAAQCEDSRNRSNPFSAYAKKDFANAVSGEGLKKFKYYKIEETENIAPNLKSDDLC